MDLMAYWRKVWLSNYAPPKTLVITADERAARHLKSDMEALGRGDIQVEAARFCGLEASAVIVDEFNSEVK